MNKTDENIVIEVSQSKSDVEEESKKQSYNDNFKTEIIDE
jgi:hypothetical protein